MQFIAYVKMLKNLQTNFILASFNFFLMKSIIAS